MWEGLDLNKFVVFLAALLCAGILCACGGKDKISDSETNNISCAVPEEVASCEPGDVTSYVPVESYPDIQFNFSFVWQGDNYYLIFDDTYEIIIPTTEHELYVLMVNGNFIVKEVHVIENDIFIPVDAVSDLLSQSSITTYIDNIPYISINDPELVQKCAIDIITMSTNDILGYELCAVVIETETLDPLYQVEDARKIIETQMREQYDELLFLIQTEDETKQLYTDERIERIKRDAAELCVYDDGSFGRYYVFHTSAFGASIYFDKYTGDIFSDEALHDMCILNITKGIYSLGYSYW